VFNQLVVKLQCNILELHFKSALERFTIIIQLNGSNLTCAGLAPLLRVTGVFNEIAVFCMLCCSVLLHMFACSEAVFFHSTATNVTFRKLREDEGGKTETKHL
jgi:hypothetical protein